MDNERIDDIKSEIETYMNLDYKIEALQQKKKITAGITIVCSH